MAEIPEHVARFISAHVDSLELIEVLLLIRKGREREWMPEEVSERLYTSPGSAARRLESLRASGLAAATPGERPAYRYAPADSALEQAVHDLEDVYTTRRTRVAELIYSRPADGLQSFADAFRLREKK